MINVGMNVVILDLGEYNKMQKMMRDMEARIKKYENAIKLESDYQKNPVVKFDVKVFADVLEQKFEESEFVNNHKIMPKTEWWSSVCNCYGIFEEVIKEENEPMTKEDFEMFMEEAGPDNDVEVKKDV